MPQMTTVTDAAAAPAYVPAQAAPISRVGALPARSRIASIDVMRGLVMLLMLVDHVREAFFRHFPVGDPVNVAARLEQIAAPGTIVVSERTARATRGFSFRRIGPLELKGKERAVRGP